MHFDNKTEFTLVTAILWYCIRQVQLYAQLNYTSRLIVTWDMQLPWCSGQKSLCTLTLGHTASSVAVKVCFKVNYYRYMHIINHSPPLSFSLSLSLSLHVKKAAAQNNVKTCTGTAHAYLMYYQDKLTLHQVQVVVYCMNKKKKKKRRREILFIKNINFVWSNFLCLPILVSVWYNIWSWLCKYFIEADTLSNLLALSYY